MSAGFDKVYEIGQIFRAEEHDTLRHLNEAISIDMEASFMDDTDVKNLLNDMMVKLISDINDKCSNELDILDYKIEVPQGKFQDIDYDEAVDLINARGIEMEYGEDLSREAEKVLGDAMDDFYFLSGWPTEIKPFYVMPCEDQPQKCHAFDLMYKNLELSSGATRIHQYDLLVEQMIAKDLSPESFESYLKAFKYGMPPHAGWGLGADRLNMVLTGVENIRECVLFPRDRHRLTP